MSVTRNGRSIVVALAAVGALLVGLAGPASAGTGPGSATRIAKTDAAYEQLGLDELEPDLSVIALRCRGHVESGSAVAECAWRSASTQVRSFQLWRLDLRVEDAQRSLVAELGADATTATDPSVSAPGAYLYAVLGLDGDGEIVARSRPDRVRFRDLSNEHLRLECDAADAAPTSDSDADVTPVIGCAWSSAVESEVRAYRLYRSVHGGERELIATVGADVTSARDADIEVGVRYLYRVEGVDAEGTTVARSRLDGAGWGKPERDHRDERRDRPSDARAKDASDKTDASDTTDGSDDEPVTDAAVAGSTEAVPDTEERESAAAESVTVDRAHDRSDHDPADRTDEHRSDAGDRDVEASPASDRGDRRGQGR